MNLLDYCSLAVPTGLTPTVPFGVTLVAQAFDDLKFLQAGAFLHTQASLPMGCGSDMPPGPVESLSGDIFQLAVCGAHLKGLPLHHQLTELGASLVQTTHTADAYRMFALESDPAKPGLIRDESAGAAIEVEIYALSASAFGRFVQQIPHLWVLENWNYPTALGFRGLSQSRLWQNRAMKSQNLAAGETIFRTVDDIESTDC